MITFYQTFSQVKHKWYDGLIITGAPVELMDFEEVEYWDELCEVMEWSKTHVHSTFHICWGAQAGLYYHYGIPKYILDKKLSGVYKHYLINKKSRLFRGFDSEFYAPHSRNTTVRAEDIEKVPDLKIMAASVRPAFMWSAIRAVPSFLLWVIPNMILIHWRKSISGMWTRV